MSKLKKEFEEDDDLLKLDLFKELFENDFLNEEQEKKPVNKYIFGKGWFGDKSGTLTIDKFYCELIDTKNKKKLHPDFIDALFFFDQKELYSFFDEEKIRKVFYSKTEESVMFFNKMLKNIKELSEISKKSSTELISCINMVLNIQDDDNKRMIDFKAKLYLNILSRFTYNKREEFSILEKINTNEKEMTEFFHKHINTKIDFDDLTEDYKTVKSRIYRNYYQLSSSCKLDQNGTLSKHIMDERALNIGKSIALGKSFQKYLLQELNVEVETSGSALPYGIGVALSFVEIADIELLHKLKKLLEKKNIYKTAKEEWFIEKNPKLVELLKEMDIKIIKDEQKYLNSIVKTNEKKKMNNRL